jgi:hypothetical protein
VEEQLVDGVHGTATSSTASSAATIPPTTSLRAIPVVDYGISAVVVRHLPGVRFGGVKPFRLSRAAATALALAGCVLGSSGCSSEHRASVPSLKAATGSIPPPPRVRVHTRHRRTRPAPRAPAPTAKQLLFAFPKLGRLYADCRGTNALRLTYTANRDVGEDVALFVNSKRAARRGLDPSRSLSLKVDVVHRPYHSDILDESPPLKLVSEVNREPYGTRVTLRFKLLQARDQSGECLAESATMRVTGDPHLG